MFLSIFPSPRTNAIGGESPNTRCYSSPPHVARCRNRTSSPLSLGTKSTHRACKDKIEILASEADRAGRGQQSNWSDNRSRARESEQVFLCTPSPCASTHLDATR